MASVDLALPVRRSCGAAIAWVGLAPRLVERHQGFERLLVPSLRHALGGGEHALRLDEHGLGLGEAVEAGERPAQPHASFERGQWKSAGGGKRERTRYSRYAKATFRKDRRLNIRLSSKDLEAIQKRALAEGLPYQTLISSLLHKYASGRLKEI